MKIVYFKEENEVPIRIFMKDMVGDNIQLDMFPGQVTYAETNEMTFSLRIFEKKGVIKITRNTRKPSYLEYYCGYSPEDVESLKDVPQKEQDDYKIVGFIEKSKTELPVLMGVLINFTDIPNENRRVFSKEAQEQMQKQLKHITDNPTDFFGQIDHPINSISILDNAIKEVEEYKEETVKEKSRKKSYYKKKVGRPKKRGPKKGGKKKK